MFIHEAKYANQKVVNRKTNSQRGSCDHCCQVLNELAGQPVQGRETTSEESCYSAPIPKYRLILEMLNIMHGRCICISEMQIIAFFEYEFLH